MNVTEILKEMAFRATEIKQSRAALIKREREVKKLLRESDRLVESLEKEEGNLSNLGEEWDFLAEIVGYLLDEATDNSYDLQYELGSIENALFDMEEHVGCANAELIDAASHTVDSLDY
jgi:hypothetical protein